MAGPSEVDFSKIGPKSVTGLRRESRAAHRTAWTQAVEELTELLAAIVPSGGAAGHVLTKLSSANFDFTWAAQTGEGGGGVGVAERVTPEDYDAPGGTANASTAVQAAINNAKGNPLKVLWLANDYYVDALTCDEHITIDGGGRLIPFSDDPDPVLRISIPPAVTTTISAFLTTTIDLSEGDAIVLTVTRLTVADTAGFTVGQPVKITSEDANSVEPISSNLLGCNATIISIDAGNDYIYLDKILPFTFTTSPKIHQYADVPRTVIRNISFYSAKSTSWDSAWDIDYCWLAGLVAPLVQNCTFQNVTNSGLTFAGVVGGLIQSCAFIEGHNKPAEDIFGYGFQDAGGYLNRVTGCYFRNLRHGMTDIALTTTGNTSDPWYFGSTLGMIGSDCSAHGCSASAFDTHHSGILCGYIDCQVDGGWAAKASAAAGFQLRGENAFVANCRASGVEYGVTIQNEVSALSSKLFIINGFQCRARKASIRARPTERITGLMRNLDLQTADDRQFDLGNCNVQMQNVLSRIVGTVGWAHIIVASSAGGCTLLLEGGTFDSTASTGTNGRIWSSAGANHVVRIPSAKVFTTSGQGWDAVVRTSDAADINATFDVEADRAPAQTNGTNNLGNGSVWLGRVRVGNGQSVDNSVVTITSTGGNRTLSEHINIFSEEVYLLFNCTTAQTDINVAEAALLRNQRVHIVNRGGSTQNLVLKNDSGNKLTMLSDRTLAPGAGATIVWNAEDSTFHLLSNPVTGGSGISGINIQIDGSTQIALATAIDFEADDFSISGSQVRVDTTNIPRNTWTTAQNAGDFELANVKTKHQHDTIQSISSSSGLITLNVDNGNIVQTTQNESITGITFSNFEVGSWMEWWVTRTNNAHTIVWPASVRWAGGSAPTLSDSGNVDKFFISRRGSLYDVSYDLGFIST